MKQILLRFKTFIVKMRYVIAAFIILAFVFKMFPQIDIYVSNLFYRSGEGFFLANKPYSLAVYHGVNIVSIILASVLGIMLIADIFFKKNILGIKRKAIIFLIIAYIAAPWLIVNEVLKEYVGRPRPANVTLFGGEATFQPAFTISNECDSNCSFVSGHASFGFYLMSFGLIASVAYRRKLVAAGFAAGALIGFVRIIQGRHFFSDVVFAFFFVWLAVALIYTLMFNEDNN